jgi:hypothetical protein
MLQTNCVRVVAVRESDGLDQVREKVNQGNISQAVELGEVVGSVQFASDSVQVQNNSLKRVVENWEKKKFGFNTEVRSIIVLFEHGPVSDNIALSQGQSIQNALPTVAGGRGEPPELVKSPKDFRNCPVILFVAVSDV